MLPPYSTCKNAAFVAVSLHCVALDLRLHWLRRELKAMQRMHITSNAITTQCNQNTTQPNQSVILLRFVHVLYPHVTEFESNSTVRGSQYCEASSSACQTTELKHKCLDHACGTHQQTDTMFTTNEHMNAIE